MRHILRSFASLAVLTALASDCKDSAGPEKPGAPTDIAISAGDAQSGAAGSTLVAPIAAKVTDARGRGVPNVGVLFQPFAGAGSVNPAAARTNGAGIATTAWTLPTNAGATARVRAVLIDTLTGALVDSVSFAASVVGGPPNQIYPSPAPSLAAAGAQVPLQVLLLDQFGNRSPNAPVTWLVTAGGGSVAPASSVSDATGVARTTFTLGAARGTNTVTASANGLTTSFTIEGRIAGQPESIAPNSYQSFGPYGGTIPLGVTVYDGLGFRVAGVSISWMVTSGAGSVSPASSTTNSNGVATAQLTLGSGGGFTTVQASAGNLTAGFTVEARNLAPRLTSTDGSAFGIARTSGGRFVVSLIHDGVVETFDQASPDTKVRIPTGGTPVVVATDAAGTFAYVSNMDGWLDIIDLATNTVAQRVPVANAHALALSPSGNRVFVTKTTGSVVSISTTTRAVVDSVAIPGGPWGIAFRTSGADTLMYVTARDAGTVTEVDARTMATLRTFNLGGRIHGLVISADGSTLYAADNAEGRVKAISISSGVVTNSVSLPGAFGIAISPDGSTLYVTTDGRRGAVITASSLAITQLYDTGGNGRKIVAAPDGASAWDANEEGWVDIIRR
jgi:YVTN family beta-propeller protein